MSKCAVCVLTEQGVKDAEKYVLPQYVISDPTKPPVPVDVALDNAEFQMFPEEQDTRVRNVGGVVGTVKAVFRALGFGKEEEPEAPESRKTAIRRRKGSLNS